MRREGANRLVLSRSNLRALLAKLDGYPPDSACTIFGGSEAYNFEVVAEEDDIHYAKRERGKMVEETEYRLSLTDSHGQIVHGDDER